MAIKPILLVILDGFGVSLETEGNPVAASKKPTFDEIERDFPFMTLQASGVAVGLPWGEAGNSEVGHLTMGSGRVIFHHLPRIINAIHDGSFFNNEAFLKAIAHVRENNSALHLAGLVSSGSVHGYIDHLYALCELATRENINKVYLHIFSDGKDAPPEEGAKFYRMLEERFAKQWPNVKIASVLGRFYALDRDEKWDRIKVAYELLTRGSETQIKSVSEYLYASYKEGITDEFVKPASVVDAHNNVLPGVRDNDALIFADFREDSMRELTHAFVDESFDHFSREKLQNCLVVTMTEYQKGMPALAAFPQLDIHWPLARVLSEAHLRHLHIAETQKYAHVTYFFNGGIEKPFPGEDRILVPSDATAHFDEVPTMKAPEITARILENLNQYDVIIANFANADMVGHTGNFEAAAKTVEVLDEQLRELKNAILNTDGVMLITGDHGNIELKRNIMTGEKLTEHSTNPVPFYLVGEKFKLKVLHTWEFIDEQKKEAGGILTDIAPTILELLGLEKPEEMTGTSLLKNLR